ncbi:MAG: glycoside hydrolase family 92 protein, partial [bacterium]|nr:glycoside hydrolase family 92 protein [Candidatus Kapabacteria bacterium]
SDNEVQGFNTSGRFCNSPTHQKIHFVARFSRSFTSFKTWSNNSLTNDATAEGKSIGAALRFSVGKYDTILVKVGISYTSIENARRNLDEEIVDWNFDRVHQAARDRWQAELSRIRVSGGSPEQRTVFYTALYHSLIHPNLFHDVSGDYRKFGDRGIGRVDGYDRYTVFSLWDTYRTLHPLLAMVWPQRQNDMTRTLIEKYREFGWLPKWSLVGMDAFSMNGDPASIVIADTWMKGIRDFDLTTAFAGMVRNATDTAFDNWARPGLAGYLHYGHIPPDQRTGHWNVSGHASTALEYYLADWSVARIATELCQPDAYKTFVDRSRGYENIWDPRTQFFRSKLTTGEWAEPFDPREHLELNYTEGNAHHYRYFLPQDMSKLISMYGGEAKFTDSLQSFFDSTQFMWNEHNFAYPYLFTFADGESWRTHKTVRTLMKDFKALPWGIRANEDAGAVSAWYVLSAIGVYPVVYGTDEYQIGSPIFDTVTITPARPGANPFVITAAGTSDEVQYVVSAELNGRNLARPQLRSSEIANGGTLNLAMSEDPSSWGTVLRPPDSLRVASEIIDGTTMVELTWRPRRDVPVVLVQISSDPTFCGLRFHGWFQPHESSMTIDFNESTREFWWRIASIDEHGAHAWSPAMLHKFASADDDLPKLHIESMYAGNTRFGYRAVEAGALVGYNMLGREVFRETVSASTDDQSIGVETSRLARGVYMCRLFSGQKHTSIAFVVR